MKPCHCLDLNFCSLVRPNSGALRHSRRRQCPHAFPERAAWLLLGNKVLVLHQVRQLVQNLRIVAAIIFERRKILIDYFVVVRECVEPELNCGGGFQPGRLQARAPQYRAALHHEHAVLPAGSSIWSHNRLVCENGGESTFVIRNIIGTSNVHWLLIGTVKP